MQVLDLPTPDGWKAELTGWKSNQRPFDHESDAQPLHHKDYGDSDTPLKGLSEIQTTVPQLYTVSQPNIENIAKRVKTTTKNITFNF